MTHGGVVGAGVVGVATAHALCRAGYRVTLIDRHVEAGRGVSAANGAQLSYAYCDALASPGALRQVMAAMLGADKGFRIRLQADPEFLIWCLRFVANAMPSRVLANTLHLLKLADASARALEDALREFDIAFDHAGVGKMILYADEQACTAGEALREHKRALGFRQEVLTRAEAEAIEPALALHPDKIARVVWSPDDAVGRPDLFCRDLVGKLRERHGLETLFGQDALGVVIQQGCAAGITFADREPLRCDAVVIATGAATDLMPRRDLGPGRIWPIQGYSLTAPATAKAMRVSITDLARKMVFARLGDELRVAGFADIGARRPAFEPARFDGFLNAAKMAFGATFDATGDIRPWSGGRPCTAESRPLIQASATAGVYLNLGHGTLGWTLAMGSAERLLGLFVLRQATP